MESDPPLSPLMAVRLAAFNYARADLELAVAIEAAREAKFSWRAVSEASGINDETARQRYGEQQATLSRVGLLRSIAEEAFARALGGVDAATRATWT